MRMEGKTLMSPHAKSLVSLQECAAAAFNGPGNRVNSLAIRDDFR
jgi:hypothetical protein